MPIASYITYLWVHMNISFVLKVKTLFLIKMSMYAPPIMMLTFEPQTVNFWRSVFWYTFFGVPIHRSTHNHSNIDALITHQFELHPLPLCGVRLPQANLSTFHTFWITHYHGDKTQYIYYLLLWFLYKWINKVIFLWYDFDPSNFHR